jgi:hypothetical protein
MLIKRFRIAGIERHGAQTPGTVRLDDGLGGAGIDIAKSDLVITGFGQ